MTNWLKFTAQQIVQLAATVAGLVVLIPPCLLQAWTRDQVSTHQGLQIRIVDRWDWHWLNAIYGNPEDGVSGQQAGYMPNANSIWRAYCWSALRNSCDALKYRFAAPAPDYRTGTYTIFGKPQRWLVGWKNENGFAVLVFHLWGAP